MKTESPQSATSETLALTALCAGWVLSWIWFGIGQAIAWFHGGPLAPIPPFLTGPIRYAWKPWPWPQEPMITHVAFGAVVVGLGATTLAVRTVWSKRPQPKAGPHASTYVIGRTSWGSVSSTAEDTVVGLGGPRSGKTARWVSRWIADCTDRQWFPVATSNKPDLVAHLGHLEPDVLDFSRVSHRPTCTWDLFAEISDGSHARRIANELIPKSGQEKNPFFVDSARTAVTALLLAVARSGGTIDDFAQSVTDVRAARRTIGSLNAPQDETVAAMAMALFRGADQETTDNVMATVRSALGWLIDGSITGTVRRSPHLHHITAHQWLLNRRRPLMVLSSDDHAAGRELATAFMACLLWQAQQLAAAQPSGRLDPPLPVVLDEAANIARISTLPDAMSHFGSRGIPLAILLQSLSQAQQAWGQQGAQKIVGAANWLFLTAGLKDPAITALAQNLGGQELVRQHSTSRSRNGSSRSISVARRPRFDAGAVGALPKGRVIVFQTGSEPQELQAPTFYEAP